MPVTIELKYSTAAEVLEHVRKALEFNETSCDEEFEALEEFQKKLEEALA